MNAKQREQLRRERRIRVKALAESGYSVEEIAKVIGIAEGIVRNILKEKENDQN